MMVIVTLMADVDDEVVDLYLIQILQGLFCLTDFQVQIYSDCENETKTNGKKNSKKKQTKSIFSQYLFFKHLLSNEFLCFLLIFGTYRR